MRRAADLEKLVLHGLALAATVAAFVGSLDSTAYGEASPSASCTMAIVPGARDSLNTMLLLGRATRDTIAAGAGGLVDPLGWRRDRVFYGQLVRVDSMLGPGAALVRRVLTTRRSTEVVVVPWGNNSGCGIAVWQRSAVWTTPDSSGLLSVRLRAESVWVAGRPTFDAFFAGNYSYADGPYTVGPHTVWKGSTGADLAGNPSMTPTEVFALYTALSTLARPSDSRGLARLRAWVRANPGVRTRYPGNQILQGLQLDPPR